jgi:hypothetical protein
MIILSIGMPRAGSGWYYNLTNDLMLAHGAQDARAIRARYHLGHILTEVNCNIGALTPRRLLMAMLPSWMGNTFVIKAHAGPGRLARRLISAGQIRPTYIYRDPRDALLSAMENGRRAQANGRVNAFTPWIEFDAALAYMRDYVRIGQAWLDLPGVHATRYESLLLDYPTQAADLARFLGLDPLAPGAAAVIERHRPERGQADVKGTHFSQGKIGRFRAKMTSEQQAHLSQAFGPALQAWGYA